jgi:hypothetical protein
MHTSLDEIRALSLSGVFLVAQLMLVQDKTASVSSLGQRFLFNTHLCIDCMGPISLADGHFSTRVESSAPFLIFGLTTHSYIEPCNAAFGQQMNGWLLYCVLL